MKILALLGLLILVGCQAGPCANTYLTSDHSVKFDGTWKDVAGPLITISEECEFTMTDTLSSTNNGPKKISGRVSTPYKDTIRFTVKEAQNSSMELTDYFVGYEFSDGSLRLKHKEFTYDLTYKLIRQ